MQSNAPVRVALVPRTAQAPRPTLAEYLGQHPAYGGPLGATGRDMGRGVGDVMLAGVFAPSALLGLFRLLRSWVELQRSHTTVKVTVNDATVEVTVDGRTDPAALVEQVLRAAARPGA